MSGVPEEKGLGTKGFLALMAILIIAFLSGLLIMNSYYTSMQSELTATKAQVGSLQTSLYNLNQNYALLQQERDRLITQVGELSSQVNLTQVASRAFSYNITIEYDNMTRYVAGPYGEETISRSATAAFKSAELAPQGVESVVADPWSAPLSMPYWLKEPETGQALGIILQASAIRAHFSPATNSWVLTDFADEVGVGYRVHHDFYTVTMTGSLQLLYFTHNRTVTLALIGTDDGVMGQIELPIH